MAKVMSAVFGVGIAVVVFILILLAIQVFYPQPKYDTFCNISSMATEPIMGYDKCLDNMTVGECRASFNEKYIETDLCYQDFDKAIKVHNKNFFIIASIIGIILIIIGFLILNTINISAGLTCAGIVLTIVAFVRGWDSTNDILKFVMGLIVASIVITLTVIANRKLSKK